jgi:hypothetical protein
MIAAHRQPDDEALGDSTGTRVMVEVLMLDRHLKHVDVLAGVATALSVGSVHRTWSRSRW